MRKAERAKEQLKKYSHLFSCPVCGSDMTMVEGKSLVCGNRHNFDLAKSGYINLLQRPVKTQYDRELLAARKLVANSGFFTPLLSVVSALLRERIGQITQSPMAILDAGCGEGSHLSVLITRLRREMEISPIGVGVDLAREGIQMAVKNDPDLIWCVADLAKLPLKNGRFGVVLNILSPANYGEFSRVLNAEGVLLKVVPGKKYLTELRTVFFADNDQKTYSNERVIRHFAKHFQLVAQQKVFSRFSVEEEMLRPLLKMTPLSWHVPKEKMEQVFRKGLKEVTVEFEVLVGQKT
ncbi:MAG: methyltransferase domain-containing protein [Firmicutes bacterium]|nr:methyltransferase domain-containing protein [Bacillota bacterium]